MIIFQWQTQGGAARLDEKFPLANIFYFNSLHTLPECSSYSKRNQSSKKKKKSNLKSSFLHLIALQVCAQKHIIKRLCMQGQSVCFIYGKQAPSWKSSTKHSENHNPHFEYKVWQRNLLILILRILTQFINYTEHKITWTRPPALSAAKINTYRKDPAHNPTMVLP